MISEMYQTFDLPSSIHSPTLARHDIGVIPRLFHKSSEGSEPDSPTGGGGSYHPQPGQHQATQSTQRPPESRASSASTFQDYDAPYIPPRQTLREQPNVNYFTSEPEVYSQRNPFNSADSSARYPYSQSSYSDLNRGFEQRDASRPSLHGGISRTGLDHAQWRPGQGQFRSHPPIYPGGDMVLYQGAAGASSSHAASGLPPLPPHTGVFEAQATPLGYHHGPESRFPDAGEYLRSQLNIGPGEGVNLWSLPTPPDGQKPPQPLPVLIKLAIYGSPRKKLTLQEIYAALEDRFQWFKDHRSENAWKNSIRHNLSLNKVFRNTARPITEPGKGSYWELDVSEGEGYKRERKRRKKTSSSQSAADDEDGSEENDEGSTSPPATQIEPPLDPQGGNDSYNAGPMRLRSNSRRNSPYLSPSPPMASRQANLDASAALHSSSGSSSPASSNASIPAPSIPPISGSFVPQPPRFGQSSFCPSSLPQPSFTRLAQSSVFPQRAHTFGTPGYSSTPNATPASSQSTPPSFNPSLLSGMYPPIASNSSSSGLYWPAQDQFTDFLPDPSSSQDPIMGLPVAGQAGQAHRLDRSKSSMFIPQAPGNNEGRGRGI